MGSEPEKRNMGGGRKRSVNGKVCVNGKINGKDSGKYKLGKKLGR